MTRRTLPRSGRIAATLAILGTLALVALYAHVFAGAFR